MISIWKVRNISTSAIAFSAPQLTCSAPPIHASFPPFTDDPLILPPLRSRIFLPTPSFRSLTLTWAGSASEGACEGSVACSTCHVILTPEFYDKLLEPSDDENDMLDMAFGLTDTSRLGCQVQLTKDLDGMIVTLPSATRNMFVDGRYYEH